MQKPFYHGLYSVSSGGKWISVLKLPLSLHGTLGENGQYWCLMLFIGGPYQITYNLTDVFASFFLKYAVKGYYVT